VPNTTKDLIKKYYKAFNENDMTTFFGLLDEQIIHDLNQGERQIGKAAFQKFMTHMHHCYHEKVLDLVVMTDETNQHASAEFIIEGTYLKTDQGLPEAKGQVYRLPVGAFFTVHQGKITRVTNYYNLQEWLRLVNK
jgi:steroid delta-isomerase-like uncharacterized protein